MPRPKGSLNKNTRIKEEVLSKKYIKPEYIIQDRIVVPAFIRCEKFEHVTRSRCTINTIKQILQPDFLLLLYTFEDVNEVHKVAFWKSYYFPELLKTLGWNRFHLY